MRRLGPAALALAAALVAACSIPEKTLIDGAPTGGPFACLSQPLPTTAPPKITIAGSLFAPFIGMPLTNTVAEVFLIGTSTSIFSVTTDATGAFSHEQGIGSKPFDMYVRAAPNGYLPTYLYPAVPAVSDVNLPLQMFTAMHLQTIVGLAGLPAVDPAKVTFLVTVADCNGMPVSGATITTNPPGMVRYFVGTTPSPTAIATDAMTGAAIVSNVDVSNTTVGATVSGMTLHAHNFDGVAGAIMETTVQP
jgi:hypothetical protein